MTNEAWWVCFIKDLHIRDSDITERCSTLLLSQLANMPSYGGMNHPFQFVVHEIRALEEKGEKTQTAKATAFRRSELAGFWKKHFSVLGYHLGENARLALGFGKEGSQKLSSLISSASKEMGSPSLLSDVKKRVFAKELAELCIKQVWARRSHAKNTGDYLVFVPYEGKKYYLCIAKHSQDSFVRDCIEKCIPQFPFIHEILYPATCKNGLQVQSDLSFLDGGRV